MRAFLLNLIYTIFLLIPLFVLSYIPIALLDTGQGGELLSNIWSPRLVSYLAFIASPYLFAMFSAAACMVFSASNRLPFLPGRLNIATMGEQGRMLAACLIGFVATLIALSPLYAFNRDDFLSLMNNKGFVVRLYYDIDVLILFLIGAGLYSQWRVSSAPKSDLLRKVFNAKSFYFSITVFLYTTLCYFDPVNRPDHHHKANAEAIVFSILAILVIVILPSIPKVSGTAQENGGSAATKACLREWPTIAVALVILISFAVFPSSLGLFLGSLMVFVAGIGAWSVLTAAAWSALLSRDYRIPRAIGAASLLGLLAFCTDRALVTDRVNTITASSASASVKFQKDYVTLAQDYNAWNATDSNPAQPTVIVLAEGGGIRASYWTANGLEVLSLPSVDLISRTYAIIGVSGGALGAATYMANYVASDRASKASPSVFQFPFTPGAFAGNVSESELSSDFLGPWLARMISTEGIQKLIPWRIFPSKGETLQDAWNASLTCQAEAGRYVPQTLLDTCGLMGPILKSPMVDFSKSLDGRRLPRLIFVATHVESGKRVLFSSVAFQQKDFPDAMLMETLAPHSADLLSAAHASARFPLISPPGEIVDANAHVAGHVVDGGYDDVSGAQTALEIVRSISQENKQNFHPIIVDLNNDPDDGVPPKDPPHRVGELETIGSTIESSRRNQGALIKRQLLNLVCDLNGGYVSLKVQRKPDGPIGLGWTLSQDAASSLMSAMRREDKFIFSDKSDMSTPTLAMQSLAKKARDNCQADGKPFSGE